MRALWLVLLSLALNGCSAVHTSVAKRHLDVQTRMSQTVYLDPVEPEQRTLFLDIRNTSAEYTLPLAEDLRQLMRNRGYQLVESPMQAQYWLQVNVRTVLKERPDLVLAQEYGMTQQETLDLLHPGMAPRAEGKEDTAYTATDFVVDSAIVSDDLEAKDVGRALVVLAVFAGAEYVGNQLVQDKYYTMLTDIQIAERISPDSVGKVQEYAEMQLLHGDSGAITQLWKHSTDMRKYQIKVVSFANKANLKWQEAQQPLHNGLLRSLAGVF